MTIEVALLISIVSVFFAIVFGMANLRRNQRTDDQKEATDLTTVSIKLESIKSDTNEIKTDIKSVKAEVRKNSEDIIRIDESLKQAWKELNKIGVKGGN